jgi:hypothetical protein
MKLSVVLLSGFLALAAGAQQAAKETPHAAPALSQVHTVYLLPMANGLDQFLANRINTSGIFQVVTDPQHAEAVFTDHLGESFEARLAELFPSGEAKPAKDEDVARGWRSGRTKGTVFLVGAHNRTLLWSAYIPPKGSGGAELDRMAERISAQLKRDLKSR